MAFGIPVMRAVAPDTLISHPASDTSKSKSTTKPRPNDISSCTKMKAKGFFHKYTADVFNHSKAGTVIADEPRSFAASPSTHHSLVDDVRSQQSHTPAGPAGHTMNTSHDTPDSGSSGQSSPNSILDASRSTPTPPSSSSPSPTFPLKQQDKCTDAGQQVQTIIQTTNVADKPTIHEYKKTSLLEVIPSQQNCATSLNMELPQKMKKGFKTKLKDFFTSTTHKIVAVVSTLSPQVANGRDKKVQGENPEAEVQDSETGWEAVRSISDDQYCQLIRTIPARAVRHGGYTHVAVTGHCEGSFHRVTFVTFYRNFKFEKYVVRVPAHGTADSWSKEDQFMMEREVKLLGAIIDCTQAPVAKVFAHDSGLQNILGMPYIVESWLPGSPSYNIWCHGNKDYNPKEGTCITEVGVPSEEAEKKRINFLRTLARAMNDLEDLAFAQTGSLVVDGAQDEQQFGPHYIWNTPGESKQATEYPSTTSTQDLVKERLDAFCDIEIERAQRGDSWDEDGDLCEKVGIRKILDIVFSQPVFNQPNERFTICHPDLDLQNILTDEDGNVTGIIDWDGAFIAPRCMGAAAAPKFLNRDWFKGSFDFFESFPGMAWRSEYYRNIYAAALMQEHTFMEHPDAPLCTKSAMYTAAISSVMHYTGGGDIRVFISKIRDSIPGLARVSERPWLETLGRGWPEMEAFLEKEIATLFEPQLPEEKWVEILRSFEDAPLPQSSPSATLEDTPQQVPGPLTEGTASLSSTDNHNISAEPTKAYSTISDHFDY